jgi:hypothetical protein
MEDSLLPECAQGKEEAAPRSERRKRNRDSNHSISKKEATETSRPLPVYQKPQPVITKNFFAPLRSVPTEGPEVCDERPSSEDNLDKGRPPTIFLTSEANLISLQKTWKLLWPGSSSSGILHPVLGSQPKVWQITKSHRTSEGKNGLPFFTFYTKWDRPVKAVTRQSAQ